MCNAFCLSPCVHTYSVTMSMHDDANDNAASADAESDTAAKGDADADGDGDADSDWDELSGCRQKPREVSEARGGWTFADGRKLGRVLNVSTAGSVPAQYHVHCAYHGAQCNRVVDIVRGMTVRNLTAWLRDAPSHKDMYCMRVCRCNII